MPTRLRRFLTRWLPASRSSRRLLFDIVIIFGIAILLRILTFDLELFERLHDFTRAHEEWEFDELVVTIAIASLASIAFGIRRIQDQRQELRLRLAAEEHANILALQDPLTGLPNRRRFLEQLNLLAAQPSELNALLMLDLDGFKPVNDLFGHASGDEALQVIAQRLKALGDNRITVARLGGDEFALLRRSIRGPADAAKIAEGVIAAVQIPIHAAGVEHRLDVSVGISTFGPETQTPSEALRRADVALYRAKEDPGSSYMFYDEGMDAVRQQRIQLENDLRTALSRGEITAHYQPIVDLKSGDIVKFEALARWRHAERGDVPPSVFIPIAESRGLIGDVTEAIIRRSFADAKAWPPSILLSINLSPVLLQTRSFGLRLVKLLDDLQFPPGRLEIEITERALKGDFAVIRPFLESLRMLGVRIALDDFGTGYSSLSRLRQLPFDNIKIDRSFVQSMSQKDEGTKFVRTILELGHGLGMTVTAEGVENLAQHSALLAEGCQQGQGFLFSEPLPGPEVERFLSSKTRAAG
jgi:diguanylate cyclase (GGDEF)-like protein